MDVDLSDMQPDFYSGSAHKWACGPKENGVLYINKSAQSKIWASIFSAYPGRVGVSRTFEGFGQRDEPAMIAFGEALKFQTKIGRAQIEKRSRELTQALIEGLKTIDGVKIWTSPDPSRTVAVVSFQPGNLDVRKLSTALYQKDHIGCATRGGQDRPGIRLSPHFYNTHADIDRTRRGDQEIHGDGRLEKARIVRTQRSQRMKESLLSDLRDLCGFFESGALPRRRRPPPASAPRS